MAQNSDIINLQNEINALKEQLQDAKLNLPETHKLITYFGWTTFDRPYRFKNPNWYKATTLITVVIVIILGLLQEIILLITVCALLLLIFTLSSTEPQKKEYKICNKGLLLERLYKWDELNDFWYSNTSEAEYLNVQTKSIFPGRLMMNISGLTVDEKKIITTHLDKKLDRKTFEYRNESIFQSSYDKFINGNYIEYHE